MSAAPVRARGLAKRFGRRTALDGVLANLFTHPLAWWLVVHAGDSFAVVEAGVALCEALVFWCLTGHSVWRAALLSLVANGATVGLSFLL